MWYIKNILRYLLGIGYRSSNSEYSFSTRQFADLTPEEISECSELYSNHYGIYNNDAPVEKRGRKIRLSSLHYQNTYSSFPLTSISICRENGGRLVGFAIFIRGEITEGRKFCWVTQLVVHQDYRKRGIGTKLLESAWCFSDYAIRGLATANAITLRTLENVTWREIDKEEIKSREDEVRLILKAVPYMEDKAIVVDKTFCQINSKFYPEPDKINEKTQKKYDNKLGCIQSGCEWLGLIFNEQLARYNKKRFVDYILFSEKNVFDAYDRMQQVSQRWNKGAREEVMTILRMYPNMRRDISILDLGCGTGRHCIEFARHGFNDVVGVDKLSKVIEYAKQSAKDENIPISFVQGDVREYVGKVGGCDIVLCLYDVIGTYRYEWDNELILLNIRKHLKVGGLAIISVMNMDLTENIVGNNKFSISRDPKRLLDLPATSAMQTSGNVFHKDMIINTDDGLVYHKEQFHDDKGLDAEYVIADKRYTKEEFSEKLLAYGFDILEARYVRAGAWHNILTKDDVNAKEILFVVKKKKMLFGL